jgi:hypothetical protein
MLKPSRNSGNDQYHDSRYGRFGGGVVNTTLKSGSNSWHIVCLITSEMLFSMPTISEQHYGAAEPKRNQHQYGGVFGGPITRTGTSSWELEGVD